MSPPLLWLHAAVVTAVLGVSVATAQDFTFFVSGELTTQSSSYSGSGDSTKSEAIVELASEDFESYSIDFGALGEGILDIEWFAPAGKCFELQVPTTYDDVELFFEWQLGSNTGGFAASGTSSPSLIFTGLTGTASLREQLVMYRDNGIFAFAVSDLVPGETVRFEAVRFFVGIEESVDKSYMDLTESFLRLRAVAAQDTSMNTPADAGQWLSIVDKNPTVTPEVATQNTTLIIPLDQKIEKLKKKLRKLKKKGKAAAVRKLKKKIKKLQKAARLL